MRRSDFDVTDTICTTDPVMVGDEVMRLFDALYPGKTSPQIEHAFKDMSSDCITPTRTRESR